MVYNMLIRGRNYPSGLWEILHLALPRALQISGFLFMKEQHPDIHFPPTEFPEAP